ncbi:MAG: hypothetical protein O3C21_10615 [Verrucomicrobia bacterium]|nr:hypothetical protein [Verrucomicrobiota bacterium]
MNVIGTNHEEKRGRYWLSVLGDFLLVAACLGLITWLLSSRDPLWLRLNPSPLILVPLLLGGRYGLVVGVAAGLLTSALGTASAVWMEFGTWRSVINEYRYLFAGLPVLGLVAGELRSALTRTQRSAAAEVSALKEANLRAISALRVAEESSHRLERQLAVHGLEMVSLDNELATILKAEDRTLYREVLHLLYRISGIQEAAIYLPANGRGEMLRIANLNGTSTPEALPIDGAIVERALVTRDLVTCREIWEATPRQGDKWLAALPWVDHEGNVRALLMVRRMALLSVNWQAFDRMKTVCQWVTCCRLMRAGTHALSDAESRTFQPRWDDDVRALRNKSDENFDRLRETARLCVRGRDLHQLSTAGLCFPGAGYIGAESECVLRVLSECLRPQDVCAADPDGDSLLVLLPMMDLSGAKSVAEKIESALRRELQGISPADGVRYASAVLQASESADLFIARLAKKAK